MARFRKKPVVIEAEQMSEGGRVFDKLHDVEIPYESGDWIVTGVRGERYACKDDVFRETYEREGEGALERLLDEQESHGLAVVSIASVRALL